MRKTLIAAAGALILATSIATTASPALAGEADTCTQISNILDNLSTRAQAINLVNAFALGSQYADILGSAGGTFAALAQAGATCPASDTAGTAAVTEAYAIEVNIIQSKADLPTMVLFNSAVASTHHYMEDTLQFAAPGATVEPTFVDPGF